MHHSRRAHLSIYPLLVVLIVLNILLLTPDNPLEPLLLHLRLSRRNSSLGIGVLEAAAVLAGLELRCLGTADTYTGGVGAAGGAAVCVGRAAAGDELGAVSGADVLSSCIVGGDGEGEGGDCVRVLVVLHLG